MSECKKCGSCCKEKVLIRDGVLTIWICPYLDENNLCKIYNKRDFFKPEWCHTIEELKTQNKLDTLPKDCYLNKED